MRLAPALFRISIEAGIGPFGIGNRHDLRGDQARILMGHELEIARPLRRHHRHALGHGLGQSQAETFGAVQRHQNVE